MEKEKKKQIIVNAVAVTLLSALLVGFIAMTVHSCAQNKEEPIANALINTPKSEPKRAVGSNYTITAIGGDMQVWNTSGGYVQYTISAGQSLTLTYLSSPTYAVKSADDLPINVGGSAGSSSLASFVPSYNITDSLNIYVTAQDPNVNLESFFVQATGESMVINRYTDDDIEFIARFTDETTMSWSRIRNATILHSPTEPFSVETAGGASVAGTANNFTFTDEVMLPVFRSGTTSLVFKPNRTSYVLKNNTLANVRYTTDQINDITPLDEYTWYTIMPGESVSVYSNTDILMNSSQPFRMDYRNELHFSYYQGSQEGFGHYFQRVTELSGNITLMPPYEETPPESDPEQGMDNVFLLIAHALGALLPILNIQVYGTLTIGVLMFLPFTFALIALIVKLIKK